jgi:hypothetical protein
LTAPTLSIGQIIALLDREKYSELITRLEAKLEDIKYLSGAIRQYRNKNLVHSDIDVALKTVEPLPVITFEAIKGTLGKIRDFMNECEGYFQDSETAYEAFTMSADGQALVNRLKKAIAYEELEKQGLIERGYWRMKSRYKGV